MKRSNLLTVGTSASPNHEGSFRDVLPRLARAGLLAVMASSTAVISAEETPAPDAEPAALRASADGRGSVVFVHPDGASASSWAAARALLVGPDGDLHWDRLPHIAVYRGHMADSLTGTSNGGATTHAFGVKVASDAYGTTGAPDYAVPTDAQGHSLSIAAQALRAGLPVGLVQSGIATEPGTGCFVASVESRRMHDAIAEQLIDSGAAVILGGGERYFLPRGVEGRHGPGQRKDDLNLIERARANGYAVVYTREELLALSEDTTRVLGLFASFHTFNDKPEEVLAAAGLPLYNPDAPTLAEMTQSALRVLENNGPRFLLVVEEEGSDNFANKNNAEGTLEACRRADETFGLLRRYLRDRPDTLVITAADSDAGGMRMVGIPMAPGAEPPARVPARDDNGAPVDGVGGTNGKPFLAAPDRRGRVLPFQIQWAAIDDVSGAVLVRAEGLNAELVRGSMDNTELVGLMRLTLFGQQQPDADN